MKKKRENNPYFDLFREDLKEEGTKEKAIEGHVNNVALYINEYLRNKDMKEGCSDAIVEYFGDYFICECNGTPNSIKKSASSIKKFYKSMVEHEEVQEEDFEYLCTLLKEKMDIWKLKCEAYLDEEENWKEIGEVSEEIPVVYIEDLVEAFLSADSNWQQYYDITTSEIVMVPNFMDDDEYSDQQNQLARDVDSKDQYIPLPNHEIVDLYAIMCNYIEEQEDKTYAKQLDQAIHGRRAIYDFLKVVQENNDTENFNFFKVETIVCEMINWCMECELPCDSKNENIQKIIEEFLKEQ